MSATITHFNPNYAANIYKSLKGLGNHVILDESEDNIQVCMESLLRKLPEKERLVLEYRFKESRTLQETTELMAARGYKSFIEGKTLLANRNLVVQIEEKAMIHLIKFLGYAQQQKNVRTA